MTAFTVKDVYQAVGAKNTISPYEDCEISSISFDTRTLEPGALFVPLIAEHDGHAYIDQAIEKGAVATLWSEDLDAAPKDFPVIHVADNLQALQVFAKQYLKQVNPIVVAITGSNGKTTTKDMTAAIGAAKYKTHKTNGNFNNALGVPITILTMPRDTELLIVEMGMNHAGEISKLTALVEPDIAVITLIGESHMAFLGSRAGIADAKMEIVEGLKDDGTLIYFGDEPLLNERVAKLPHLRTKTFGETEENSLYPVFIEEGIRETTFATNKAPKQAITLPIAGKYNVNNAMAAMLVGECLGIDIDMTSKALADFDMTKNRLEWIEGIKNLHILNDAYNASPTSMKASISYFSHIDVANDKWLVLGEMGELGKQSDAMHVSIKEVIEPELIANIVLYGEGMQPLYAALNEEGKFSGHLTFFTGDKAPMIDYLKTHTQPRDYVLVKSSLSTDLLQVVDALRKH